MLLMLAAHAAHAATRPGSPYDDRAIDVDDAADAVATRAELRRFVWGDGGLPADKLPLVEHDVASPVSGLVNLRRVDALRVPMVVGVTGVAYHFIPEEGAKGRLIVVHQGHSCKLQDSIGVANTGEGIQRTIAGALAHGYGVLAVQMPASSPDNCRPGDHADLFAFTKPPLGNAMRYFLEPTAVGLNYVATQGEEDGFAPYGEFAMVGLSGGGWATTVYSAIDTRITRSVSVAGSLPLYLRQGNSIGDEEQFHQAFYARAGYLDLYLLASSGTGRVHREVQIRRDECCFGAAPSQSLADENGQTFDEAVAEYTGAVRARLSTVGPGTFRVDIDEAGTGHRITNELLTSLVWPTLARTGDGPPPAFPPQDFPPETFLRGAPEGATNKTGASVEPSSDVANPGFECRLDTGAWARCTSPHTLSGLAPGEHVLAVRAKDRTGSTDRSPATATWTVDTSPPTTSLDATEGLSREPSAGPVFASSEEGSTFECARDGGDWAACTSPFRLDDLPDGEHTFSARAVDAAGNVDPAPPVARWTIDTAPPLTSIEAAPTGVIRERSGDPRLGSSEEGSTFECRPDQGEWEPCDAMPKLRDLADGEHTFSARATDAAGNTDPAPPIARWRVDTTAPETSITAIATAGAGEAGTRVDFASTEVGSRFECSLDGGAPSACSSPHVLGALAEGEHALAVRAIDALGHADPTPATVTWTAFAPRIVTAPLAAMPPAQPAARVVPALVPTPAAGIPGVRFIVGAGSTAPSPAAPRFARRTRRISAGRIRALRTTTGTVSFRAILRGSRPRTLELGRRRLSLRAGRSAPLTLRLSKRRHDELRAAGTVEIVVTVRIVRGGTVGSVSSRGQVAIGRKRARTGGAR